MEGQSLSQRYYTIPLDVNSNGQCSPWHYVLNVRIFIYKYRIVGNALKENYEKIMGKGIHLDPPMSIPWLRPCDEHYFFSESNKITLIWIDWHNTTDYKSEYWWKYHMIVYVFLSPGLCWGCDWNRHQACRRYASSVLKNSGVTSAVTCSYQCCKDRKSVV